MTRKSNDWRYDLALFFTVVSFVLVSYCSGCRQPDVPESTDCRDHAYPKEEILYVRCPVDSDVSLEKDVILCKCRKDAGR